MALCRFAFAGEQNDIHIKGRRAGVAKRGTDSVYTHRAVDEYLARILHGSEYSLKYLRVLNPNQYRITPKMYGASPVGRRCRFVKVSDAWNDDDRDLFYTFAQGYRNRTVKEAYKTRFGSASLCFEFDFKLAAILDLNTHYDSFALKQFEEIQKDKSLQPISVSIAGRKIRTKLTENGLTGTYTIAKGTEIQMLTPPKVSREDFKKLINDLKSRYATLTNLINAWTCKNQLTDKSATYYTLFEREEKDALIRGYGYTLPHLDMLSDNIGGTIKQFSSEFDAEVDDFVRDVRIRFENSKNLMKRFGGSEASGSDALSSFQSCLEVSKLIPGAQ
ncbi:hypothetical protein TWF481_000054 [Arthrobotrys musiformis]|uniref:Uncharacterized protein n=1 Tax=Arthrobotrys musiformis TaxID=47236 RepID=A0AAV9WLH6_9PEZI